MSRSFSYSALALRVKASGESREAWFLSAEEGIIRATLFGGPKSRLRSHVAPFHEGTLMIYRDPVKDTRKVTDFDVQSWRPGIREVWERAMAADALAETILAFQGGGGNWADAFKLATAVLDTLNEASAGNCSLLITYFFWHWIQILGLKPDISACASCRREEIHSSMSCSWYSIKKEAFFCENCVQNADLLLRIDPGTRVWLTEIELLPSSALETITIDAVSLEQARALSQTILAGALGRRLSTWEGV